MRIILDLQGAQTTGSRHRGIGRYTLSLAQAIVRQAGDHEVLLALNGLFPETIEPIRASFNGLLPQKNIRVWQAPGPISALGSDNTWRRRVAERIREAFLVSLKPDVVHVSSLFEGLGDDAATSIGKITTTFPTSVTLYDLIPMLHREIYLSNPVLEAWYEGKLDHMRRTNLWLAISESSRREGIDYLGLPEEWVVNVSTAADTRFRLLDVPEDRVKAIYPRYGLIRPFVMYTGGIDHRKNIEGLIRAYARLPEGIRRAYQLAIVCSIQPGDRQALERLASSQGLAPNEVIFTGFVSDEELVDLYNLCHVFAFPSWHEGFGLPALEAMACGAAVIGANTSSIPEVIGRGDALFDPFDDDSIATKLAQVLTDDTFRSKLQRHGLEQAKNFSWERSASSALEAFERLHQDHRHANSIQMYCRKPYRPRLAFVSPLPPEKSGIADYSAELLPELAVHYEIDVIVYQPDVTVPWVKANYGIHSAEGFAKNAWRYDRILYHFGNSFFHQHMFELLKQNPGVVVLHDFFLSSVLDNIEFQGINFQWTQALYLSHGYHAIRERFKAVDKVDVVWKYPCNNSVLQQSKGIIVHSNYSRCLAEIWYGEDATLDWVTIPHLRVPALNINQSAARKALGLQEKEFIICSFGMLGPTKLNHRLLSAWLASSLAKDKTCRLIFVGQNHGGEYGAKLVETIRKRGFSGRVQITGFAPGEQYRYYLAAADVAVQLRTLSRGETSGTVLDCMNHYLPTVINAHGSMTDLPQDCVIMLPDEFSDDQLVQELEAIRCDPQKRHKLGEQARAHIVRHHSPRLIAEQYAQAIESFYNSSQVYSILMQSVADLECAPTDEGSWFDLAQAIAESLPQSRPQRQLLVDVSELMQRDTKSGIQRVVRSVLSELLEQPPTGFKVEPVYATTEFSYRYARSFTLKFLGCPMDILSDDPVEIHPGDVFLGLDLQPEIVPEQAEFLTKARNLGVGIYFVVYDLLPLLYPDYFPLKSAEILRNWLSVVARGDGVLCISRAVASELVTWLNETQPNRHRPFKIGWFHLGGDIDASMPTSGLAKGFEEELSQICAQQTVLVVGTVEPRKGHALTLGAFEKLWAKDVPVNLVFVGNQGWKVEDLAERIHNHPELGKRLFWYKGISDEALLKLYKVATGVLQASEGEGFGLPLIEAARHHRPIMARDIPVFREVASDYASFFSGSSPEELAEDLNRWLEALQTGTAPCSEGITSQTWAESTQQITGLLTNSDHPNWIHCWVPRPIEENPTKKV